MSLPFIPPFSVIRASTSAQTQVACDILIEAARWMISRGQPLWDPSYFTPANIMSLPDESRVFLLMKSNEAVGTFLLQSEDPEMWPDVPPGEAIYIHALAVTRKSAGLGLSRIMLDSAVQETIVANRPYLRLECLPHAKLCAIYESAGFKHHSDGVLGKLALRRYQRSIA